MFLTSASVIKPYMNLKHPLKPSFRGDMSTVRYVIVDGHVDDNKLVIEDVTKQFIKKLKQGNITDFDLKTSLRTVMPEYTISNTYQEAKFLKLNMLGKEINVIVGESANKLKRIWEQSGIALADKKKQAGDVIRSLIYDKTSKHIAIDAVSQQAKGKVKYVIKKIFVTV